MTWVDEDEYGGTPEFQGWTYLPPSKYHAYLHSHAHHLLEGKPTTIAKWSRPWSTLLHIKPTMWHILNVVQG